MLADRLYDAMSATFDLLAVYVGERLGWYTALAQEPRTAAELPAEHAEVLLDPESLLYAAPLARFAVSLPLEDLLDAYRDGGGVPWEAYGADGREAQAALNRPLFTHLLTQEWLPAIPDVHEQLQNGARVAELACGGGWASIAIAKAYPHAEVHGFDVDEASIELARANAADVPVRFEVRDIAQVTGDYDVVFVFEAIHDLARPVEALAAMRAVGGTAIVMDERTGDPEHERLLSVGRDRHGHAAGDHAPLRA